MRWPNLNPLRRHKPPSGPINEQALSEQTAEDDDTRRAELQARPAAHLVLGQRGESLAALYLERAGYQLVAANFKLPVGRNLRGALVRAELDLIAYDGRTLCFIEVKTRASDWYAPPQANVDLRKQRQISRAARAYKRLFGLTTHSHRYDVVTVLLPPETERRAASRIELLKNFWTDEKFRKRRWSEAPPDSQDHF